MPAQARSLGFSAIIRGSGFACIPKSLQRGGSIYRANTNIKICMKLEDPTETWDFFHQNCREAYVHQSRFISTKENQHCQYYMDTKSSSFERRARIDLTRLKRTNRG